MLYKRKRNRSVPIAGHGRSGPSRRRTYLHCNLSRFSHLPLPGRRWWLLLNTRQDTHHQFPFLLPLRHRRLLYSLVVRKRYNWDVTSLLCPYPIVTLIIHITLLPLYLSLNKIKTKKKNTKLHRNTSCVQ